MDKRRLRLEGHSNTVPAPHFSSSLDGATPRHRVTRLSVVWPMLSHVKASVCNRRILGQDV